MYKHLIETLLSVIREMSPEVECWVMCILCSILVTLFSTAAAPFYTPNSFQGFRSLHPHQYLLFCVAILIAAMLMGVK